MKNALTTEKGLKRLYASAERTLDRQVLLPLGKRDEGLIEECEQTMLYCRGELDRMSRAAAEREAHPAFKRRRSWVTAFTVLAVLVVAATAAYAAGVTVLSQRAYVDGKSVRIDYGVEGTGLPEASAGINGVPDYYLPAGSNEGLLAPTHVSSEEELKSLLPEGMLYPGGELEFVGAELYGSDDAVEVIRAEYSLSGSRIIIEFDPTEDDVPGYWARSFFVSDNYTLVYDRELEGVACFMAKADGHSICDFKYGPACYTVMGSVEPEVLEGIVINMLKEADRNE